MNEILTLIIYCGIVVGGAAILGLILSIVFRFGESWYFYGFGSAVEELRGLFRDVMDSFRKKK